MTMTDERVVPDLDALAGGWLAGLQQALREGAAGATGDLFHDDAWWRDLLALTWDLRTAHGHDALAERISEGPRVGAVSLALAGPATLVEAGQEPWVQAMFELSTPVARGRGVLRLVERGGAWKAWTLLTAMDALVDHEELTGLRRPLGGAQGADRTARSWSETRRRQEEFEDGEPAVLVVGAGHGGPRLAARLGASGADALVVDRNPADRRRLAQPLPTRWSCTTRSGTTTCPTCRSRRSWPVYTPKDKLADWLESYAAAMELNVWTGTERSTEHARGEESWTWSRCAARTAAPARSGRGTSCWPPDVSGIEPNLPDLPGAEEFTGLAVHSKRLPAGGRLRRQAGRGGRQRQQRPRRGAGALRRRAPRSPWCSARPPTW